MQLNFCTQCGQPVQPGANFCAHCGAAFYAATPQAATHQQPQTQPQYNAQQTHAPSTASKVTLPLPQPIATSQNPPTQSPEFNAIVPRRHLAPRAKILFFFNYLFITSILMPFIIGFFFFDPLFAATLAVGYLAICYIAAMITYNCFYFSIDQNGFEKDYGVFFKKHVSIPFDQIQNVNTTRTILDRAIGIARLDIETAGSTSHKKLEIAGGVRSHSEGHLPGITADDARKFHDLLLRKVREND